MGQGQKVGILVLLWGFLMSFQPSAKFRPEALERLLHLPQCFDLGRG